MTADAPLLKTERVAQSVNMTGDQINALPLTQGNDGLRNPLAFAQLTPSMSVPSTDTNGNIQDRVNGLLDSSFRVLVDGQDITTGDAVPIELSEVHSFENTGSEPLEFMIVGVSVDANKR